MPGAESYSQGWAQNCGVTQSPWWHWRWLFGLSHELVLMGPSEHLQVASPSFHHGLDGDEGVWWSLNEPQPEDRASPIFLPQHSELPRGRLWPVPSTHCLL